jgi:hypothetical protein
MDSASAVGGLAHYMSRDGKTLSLPIGQLGVSAIEPTDFQQFRDLLPKLATGSGMSVDFSQAFSTKGINNSLLVGHLVLELQGIVSVSEGGDWAFRGKVTALPDTYDFNKANYRTAVAEALTTLGRQIPGKAFDIVFRGAILVEQRGDSVYLPPASRKELP